MMFKGFCEFEENMFFTVMVAAMNELKAKTPIKSQTHFSNSEGFLELVKRRHSVRDTSGLRFW